MQRDAGPGLVVATAGHVDHGKSTLVRSLTGTDPDRLAEEQRRGRSIVLGYAVLPGEPVVSFVDVPGHRDHVGAALGGLAALGPHGAVVLVVAADDGWMPQTDDHVAAIAALRLRVAALVLTRADRVDAGRLDEVAADVANRLDIAGVRRWTQPLQPDHPSGRADGTPARTSDSGGPGVVASTSGLDDADGWPVLSLDARDAGVAARLAEHLRSLARAPAPEPRAGGGGATADLWVDRVFSPRGVGTVVTGTLSAGEVARGDRLVDALSGAPLVVRGVQQHGEDRDEVRAPARVALRLRGAAPAPGTRLRPRLSEAVVPRAAGRRSTTRRPPAPRAGPGPVTAGAVEARGASGAERPGASARETAAGAAVARTSEAVSPGRRMPAAEPFPLPDRLATSRVDVVLTATVVGGVGRKDGRGAWALHVGTACGDVRLVPLGDAPSTASYPDPTTSVPPVAAAETAPGQSAATVAEAHLDRDLPLAPGDRFVVRDLTDGRVVGGGEVLDPCPPPRGRGRVARAARAEHLRRVAATPLDERPALLVEERGGWVDASLAARLGATAVVSLVRVGDDVATADAVERLRTQLLGVVRHTGVEGTTIGTVTRSLAHPSSGGATAAPPAAGRSDVPAHRPPAPPEPSARATAAAGPRRLHRAAHDRVLDARVRAVAALLVEEGTLLRDGDRLVAPEVERGIEDAVERGRHRLERELRRAAGAGIALSDVASLAGVPGRHAVDVLRDGRWTAAEGRVVHHDAMAAAMPLLAALHAARGPFTVADARDVLGGSRRTVVPLLAALDAVGATSRHGDTRTVVVDRAGA